MYVRLETSYQVVSLPNDYLTLTSTVDNKLTFDVRYQYDQELGVKNDVTRVVIIVSKTAPPAADATNALRTSLPLATNALEQERSHVELLKQWTANEVKTTVNSDPTSSVSNEAAMLLKRGYSAKQLPQLRKRAPVVVAVDDPRSAPTVTALHAQHDIGELYNSERQLAEELIALGVDPSEAYEVNDLGLSTQEAWDGTMRKSPAVFSNISEKTKYRYKSLTALKPVLDSPSPGEPGVVNPDSTSGQNTVAMTTAVQRFAEIVENVQFEYVTTPSSLPHRFETKKTTVVDPDRLYITFQATDASGVVVQVVTRVFYPGDYIKYHSVPTIAPAVSATAPRNNNGFAVLSVRQLDPVAKYVRIYRRLYNHFTLEFTPYEQLAEFDLRRADGQKHLYVPASLGNANLYRVVPLGDNKVVGSAFATRVVLPTLKTRPQHVVVSAVPQLAGVQLEVRAVPSDCVSFQLVKKDLTTGGDPTAVGTPTLVDGSDSGKVYTVQDTDVNQGHVYNYGCTVHRKSGSSFTVYKLIHEHVMLVESLVDTSIVDARVVAANDGYDVRFTIQSKVVSTDVDQYKELLQQQGLYELFTQDVAAARDQLGKLLAHNVTRVDLKTGEVENFGTVTTTDFSDKDLRASAGVSDLLLDGKYRYIVRALLRAPETMLPTFVKQAVDVKTGRTYYYKPFKFFHPLVSSTGSTVTDASVSTLHPQDQMSFGQVGNFVSTDISLDSQKPIVVSSTRESFGVDTDVLKWSLRGSAQNVDHFQILVDHGGKKEIVARAVCPPGAQTFTAVRKLRKYEAGLDLQYLIAPVYHDFTRGSETLVANVNTTGGL